MATSYYIIKGIAPPGLSREPMDSRLRFWQAVVDYGLRRKDFELSRGLNARGEPLPGIAEATRKHRRSEMTPSGRGDPRAPYLMPGRGLSRTRSLLAGKAHTEYAEFFWRYDPWTGDQWGKVLAYHARRGKSYDVVGLSPKGVAWVQAQAIRAWRAWKSGAYVGSPGVSTQADVTFPQAPAAVERPGRTDLRFATFGIGADQASAQRAIDEGRSSGFMGAEEWARYWRSRRAPVQARPGMAPSVTRGQSNVILQRIWSPTVQARAERIEAGINNLLAGIGQGLSVDQLEKLLGGLFEAVLAEAFRRGLVAVTREAGGRQVLRVIR